MNCIYYFPDDKAMVNQLIKIRGFLLRKILYLFPLLLLTCFTTAQNKYFKSFQPDIIPRKTILIGKSFSTDCELSPFKSRNAISTLTVSGDVKLNSDSSIVRIVLIDNQHNEYLVFETYPLLAEEKNITFENVGEETIIFNNIIPVMLDVKIIDATLKINKIFTSRRTKISEANRTKRLMDQSRAKIDRINETILRKGLYWDAGETSVSLLSYQEKKKMFGGRIPNLHGFEYYKGGIFVLPGTSEDNSIPQNEFTMTAESEESSYVKEYSWRNRHGQDWVTPVKSQGSCGSCWAFAAVGVTELLVNLYYNQHIDPDLSEQDILSCSSAGSCNGGDPGFAMNYIRNTGVVDENCFQYKAEDLPCSDKCSTPYELIRIGKQLSFYYIEDTLKSFIIHEPLICTIKSMYHVMTLVGYKDLQVGDSIFLRNGWSYIDINDPLAGKTAWLFKNSWGETWGDKGFVYIVTDMDDFSSICPTREIAESINFDESDIVCADEDNDGYYNWGIGKKPGHCPDCPDESDGDDSNPCFGPMDKYGFITSKTPSPLVTGDTTILAGEPVPELVAIGENVKWYTDFPSNPVFTGNTFIPCVIQPGNHIYYVTQTIDECESKPERIVLTILLLPPVTNDIELILGEQAILTATGENIRWYSESELINLVNTGNIFNTGHTGPGRYTYFATQTINGYESKPASAVLNIIVPPPVAEDTAVFVGQQIPALTATGNNIKWYTENPFLFNDTRDGKVYRAVNIGNQNWMQENLNHYTPSGSCYYDYDSITYSEDYGRLYTWGIAQDVCPEGWHLPSSDEWNEMIDYLGGRTVAGGKLKEAGFNYWQYPNTGATNESGFTAVAAGYFAGYPQKFNSFKNMACFRTTSDFTGMLYHDSKHSSHYDPINKEDAMSVRCVREVLEPCGTGNIFNTGKESQGFYTYYVTQTIEGFESQADTVTLTIIPVLPAPVANDVTICEGEHVPELIAVGENIKWYDDPELTNLLASSNRYTPGVTQPGVYIFYVTQTISGFESPPDTLYFTINAIPQPPEIDDVTICKGEEITLEASGDNIHWYCNQTDSLYDNRDGQSYKTCGIGKQVWMAENLNYSVPGKSTYYNNDSLSYAETYGRLYEWIDVLYADNCCPSGWKMPSDEDWEQVELFLGIHDDSVERIGWRGKTQGGMLKERGTDHWQPENILATDRFNFSALPGGLEYYDFSEFENLYSDAYFWTSTNTYKNLVYYRRLSYNSGCIYRNKDLFWNNRLSIRCLKETSDPIATGNTFIPNDSLAGSYIYFLTQTVNGCESPVSTVNVTIKPLPSPPAVNDTTICEGETIPALIANGENIKWYDDEQLSCLIHSGNDFTPEYTKPGTYIYFATQTINDCESIADSVNLEIHNLPYIYLGRDTSITMNENLILCTNNPDYTCVWSNGSNQPSIVISGATIGLGEHSYWALVTDSNLCSNADTILITTVSPASIPINGYGSMIRIYPNPAESNLLIDFTVANSEYLEIKIINQIGIIALEQKYFLEKPGRNQLSIDVSALPGGLYTLIVTNDKMQFSGKFIIAD
jgi:uncharacterized protein (TIGR02145 family)